MKGLERIIHDDSNGLDYILVGEVYLPLLAVPNETREIGFYGSLHRNYLKDYKSGLYSYLSLSGKLWSYLADVNEQCVERRDFLMDQMMEQEGITEELKSRDQMEWVRRANNVKSRVDEIILNEMVYGGRQYLEKQDYIRMKQKEEIAEQQETIEQQIEIVNANRLDIAKQRIMVRGNEQKIQEQEEKLVQQEREFKEKFISNSDRIMSQGELIEEQKQELQQLTNPH